MPTMFYNVRHVWNAWALAALAMVGGCVDALSVPNPRNCVTSDFVCEEGFVCSPNTQRCEPAPLTPARCAPEPLCDANMQNCTPRCFVLGQPDERSNLNVSYGLYTPWAAKLFVDKADGGTTKLAVADWENARTLIWNEVPTQNRPADVVLGQRDLVTTSALRKYGPVAPGTLYTPWSIASDGFKLLVADRQWNRVAVWSSIPKQNSDDGPLPPSWFLGQSDYTKIAVQAG